MGSAVRDKMLYEAAYAPASWRPDGLRQAGAPLVPEVRLLLAEDPTLLWARLEAGARRRLPPPFWASAWTGGQALARYVLDHPEVVAGRRVLDLASGSGLVGIAAALAGAAAVSANDVDPDAIAATAANADLNAVEIDALPADLLAGDGAGFDVVLAGDVLYSDVMAPRVLRFLERAHGRGAHVLIGDPGRGRVPHDRWAVVATYRLARMGSAEDAQNDTTSVLAMRG